MVRGNTDRLPLNFEILFYMSPLSYTYSGLAHNKSSYVRSSRVIKGKLNIKTFNSASFSLRVESEIDSHMDG